LIRKCDDVINSINSTKFKEDIITLVTLLSFTFEKCSDMIFSTNGVILDNVRTQPALTNAELKRPYFKCYIIYH